MNDCTSTQLRRSPAVYNTVLQTAARCGVHTQQHATFLFSLLDEMDASPGMEPDVQSYNMCLQAFGRGVVNAVNLLLAGVTDGLKKRKWSSKSSLVKDVEDKNKDADWGEDVNEWLQARSAPISKLYARMRERGIVPNQATLNAISQARAAIVAATNRMSINTNTATSTSTTADTDSSSTNSSGS